MNAKYPPLINIAQEDKPWKPPNPGRGEEEPYLPERIDEEHYIPLILESSAPSAKEAIVEFDVPSELRMQFRRLWFAVKSSPKLFVADHERDQEGVSEAA